MIKHILIPIGILTGAAAAGLLSMRPYNKRQHMTRRRFGKCYIAHRGLFNSPEIPENSMAAFAKAAEKGYGIELDVQLTSDNRMVVFHDDTLLRMCGDHRLLRSLSYKELKHFRLDDSDEKIPLLKDVLKLVNGRVPLVVEIKPEGRFISAAKRVAAALDKYPGVYCIESFNPVVLFWFRCHRPAVLRGQLSTVFKKDGDTHPRPVQFVLSNLLLNFLSKPDFISYNHKHTDRLAFRICNRLFKPVNAAWTIKSRKDLEAARKYFEIFIFDSFLPA